MLGFEERSAAFRRIYEAHYSAIAAYARRRLDPHDADDLVAETFLVAWRRIEDVPPGDRTLPWLYAVAGRTLMQRRRSRRRWDRLVVRLGSVRQSESETAGPPVETDDREVVSQALARLRPQDQELLRLAEWEELGRAELARTFGCTPNAIAIRLHRAHRRFSQALEAVDRDMVKASRREGSR